MSTELGPAGRAAGEPGLRAASQLLATEYSTGSGTLDRVRSATDPSDARRAPALTDRTVLLVGGVPGAGKSTAIGLVIAGRTDVDVIDSDMVRRWLRARLPQQLPYRWSRWLVHTGTLLWMIAALLRGPIRGRRLLVHDPSTRQRRRELFVRLARSRGWQPDLLFVDVSREDAQRGQRDRRRVVRSAAFDRHWARWLDLRREVLDAPAALDGGRWRRVELVDRAGAAATLHALLETWLDTPERAAPAPWSLVPDRTGRVTAPLDDFDRRGARPRDRPARPRI